jgi:hypothetical protein
MPSRHANKASISKVLEIMEDRKKKKKKKKRYFFIVPWRLVPLLNDCIGISRSASFSSLIVGLTRAQKFKLA